MFFDINTAGHESSQNATREEAHHFSFLSLESGKIAASRKDNPNTTLSSSRPSLRYNFKEVNRCAQLTGRFNRCAKFAVMRFQMVVRTVHSRKLDAMLPIE